MQKVHCYFVVKFQLIINIKFQDLFQTQKFFFTFPLQYLFTIGH